jgi:hypothetical protein
MPIKYFIQLGDFPGGMTYLKWFDKNFPDDNGVPEFLFEQAIILFKSGKIKEAEQKAFQTFCSNPYWFNKFFGKPITPLEIWHSSNLTTPGYTEALEYSKRQGELTDFAEWLDKFTMTDNFTSRSRKYIDIYKRLKMEIDPEMRYYLVRQARQLEQAL